MEVIYADYNATTPLENDVVQQVAISLNEHWGNPSSSHRFGLEAKESIDIARKRIAHMINAKADGVIFTSGGTEANNMVVNGALNTTIDQEIIPHVITTNVEHDSVDLPLRELEKRGKIEVTRVKAINGLIECSDVMSAVKDNTVLVTIMAANNETGVIMPIVKIGEQLFEINKKRNQNLPKIVFHSDAAQIIGKLPVDVEKCHLDCLTIVGHKFYGPRIGALWTRDRNYIAQLLYGGGQENGIRPGTENTAMIVGLGVAAQLVIKNLYIYERSMRKVTDLLKISLKDTFEDKVVINCEECPLLPNTLNVSFLDSSSGKDLLDRCEKLVASVGAACHSDKGISQVLLNSGISEYNAKRAIRISLGRETTLSTVEAIVSDIEQALYQ